MLRRRVELVESSVPSGRQISALHPRRGAIAVLAAFMLVVMLGFTALAVDIGYIAVNRNQMQNAADSAALAASVELARAWGVGSSISEAETLQQARDVAVLLGEMNQMAGRSGVFIDPERDMRFGNRQWDTGSDQYVDTWGVGPYNLVEVTVRRTGAQTNPDGAISLFFAPILGEDTKELTSKSKVALYPGVGFQVEGPVGQWANLLPITFDEYSWNRLLIGRAADNYAFDDETGVISSGSDGVLELDMYPTAVSNSPPGNRGTVDFGSGNNSTKDLERQIVYGLNEDDLAYYGGEFRLDDLPLKLNGDTGLSVGIENELKSVIGMPRAMPVFGTVTGKGNKVEYTVTKFVGIRILAVNLRGSRKYVIAQPASFTDGTIVRGENRMINQDSILAPGVIID